MEEVLDHKLVSDRVPEKGVDQTERDLVMASQRGDSMAFNGLVLRWEPAIYNLALRMLQDPEEAAEAVQDVFEAAFRNIRRFRVRSRFSTWLYRIAANRCLTQLHRRPAHRHSSLNSDGWAAAASRDLPASGSPEGELLLSERRRIVGDALLLLTPQQRIIVELKFFQERTFEEIAGVLRLPSSTVKSRFYTGLAQLKKKLSRSAIHTSGVAL